MSEADHPVPRPSPSPRTVLLLALALVVGVAARCLVATLGHNFDTISYTIVASIVDAGGNVYAQTSRYNYAPPWSFVVHQLAVWASGFRDPFAAFKWMLTLLLTLADVALAALLYQRAGPRAACLFFLNPISVIITGYHRQFDNIALLVGLLALGVIEGHRSRWRPWIGGAVLALSLAIKHVLFALPVWLAAREEEWRSRLVVLLLPPALFVASFLPYWAHGRAGIVENVFLYRGYDNIPLLHALVPGPLRPLLPPTLLFLVVLVGAGVLLRRRPPFEGFLLYTLLLVTFAPSVTNQALAIVVPAIATFPSAIFAAFTAVATVHLLVHHEGLQVAAVSRIVPAAWVDYPTQVALLLAGTLWLLFREPVVAAWRRLRGRPPGGTMPTPSA